MELKVLNMKGVETGKTVSLNDSIFGIEPNDHALYLAVKQFMANGRQGTHKSKERSEMSGSTRKLIRQKGGGGARRGDINSPVLVGGARVFGPVPRDYSFKLNKKVRLLARKSALAYKAQADGIIVLDEMALSAPKTKELIQVVDSLKLAGKKVLFVVAEENNFVYLSARNLQKVDVVLAKDLNTYAILDASSLVMTEAALSVVEAIFKA